MPCGIKIWSDLHGDMQQSVERYKGILMEKFISNSGQEFVIFEKLTGKKCLIKFTETGSVREVYTDNARAGKVKDLYALTVYGVGCLGEYNRFPYWKQSIQLWRNMMKRCYSEKDNRGYKFKKGTQVEARWLCFANFLEDIHLLPNFDKWLAGGSCSKTRYNLDKDLIDPSLNIYSRYTCSFTTEHDNKRAGAINARLTDPRYTHLR